MRSTHASLTERLGLDALLCVLLFTFVVVYLVNWPRNLGASDEGLYLYEAKRLLDGELFYRDIYEIVTPGSYYLMAFLFSLFGTSITTARIAFAILHGGVVVLVYLTCRELGVRRIIAAPTALVHLAIGQPAWPYASPHWVSTFLIAILLPLTLRRGWAARPRRLVGLGVIVGGLILVQQQRAVFIGLAVAGALVVDYLVGRRFGTVDRDLGGLSKRTAYFAAIVALVAVPPLAIHTAIAGVAPTVRALVIHPLINYRRQYQGGVPWASVSVMTLFYAAHTLPRVLKYLPVVLGLGFARAVWNWWQRRNAAETAALLILVVFGLCSIVSINYQADFIHVTFIAPVFFVAIAEAVEWAVKPLDRVRIASAFAAPAVGLCLLAAVAVQLYQNFMRSRDAYTMSIDTPFGRIDTFNPSEVELVHEISALLQQLPSRELFIYPGYASLYLMTGARNPTPYQILVSPSYNDPDQVQNAVDILEARRVPLVLFPITVKQDDVLARYVREHYVQVENYAMLWRRKQPG
jgi:hypothetical protein